MSNSNQILLLRQMIERAQKQIDTAQKMLARLEAGEEVSVADSIAPRRSNTGEEGEIVEGVFDGINMIGSNGRTYTIPANYASKSKLVEGDVLKLTISDDGSFLYKQIGPVERKRLRGALMQDEDTGEYSVMAQGNTYKVLTASITFFKGEIGDEVIILVPSDKQSHWAAVENVIKSIDDHGADETEAHEAHSASGGSTEDKPKSRSSILDDATADLL